MALVQIYMFSKLKKHWVFVKSWIKGKRSEILANEVAHIKVTKNIITTMFLKCI